MFDARGIEAIHHSPYSLVRYQYQRISQPARLGDGIGMQESTAIAASRSGSFGAAPAARPEPGVRSEGFRSLLRRWLVPSMADCLFIALTAWLFMAGSGWKVLLGDADTGWHIRTGEYILDHRAVPTTDLFSFSKAGQPWYAWEWLSDVLFALLYRGLGLKGVVLAAGLVLALAFTVIFRHALWRGADGAVALGVTLMAASASTIHFLARPHVFTLLLAPLSLWLLDRDLARPGRAVWFLAPMAAVWTNLHGGFLVLVAAVWLCAAAEALKALRPEEFGKARWRPARRYLTLAGLCSLATLANPFGWRLHAHIGRYLGSDWIREAVEEFQSPRFRSESMAQFEALLFAGLVVAGVLVKRRDWYHALLIGFWAHASLGSARHVPIFALVVAPVLAGEASGLWRRWSAGWPKRSLHGIVRDVAAEFGSGRRSASVWAFALVLALVLVNPPGWWPADFPEVRLPVGLVNRHLDGFAAGQLGRILAPDQWGDYLIYRFYPRQRVFIDGRSDFYGPELGRDYVRMINGHYQWRTLMARYGFDAALIPPGWPLAELLKRDSAWCLAEDDGRALLFLRRGARRALNNPADSAERLSGGQEQMAAAAARAQWGDRK